MTDGVARRTEIDNKGHYALQWVAGGGAALLVQFYFQAIDKVPTLGPPIAWGVALNLLALLLSLSLHFLRRTTSLRFDTNASNKWIWSKVTWGVWFAAIGIIAISYAVLATAFICSALNAKAA